MKRKKRFKREAKAVAALNHPNIAHIYAIDEEEREAPHRHGIHRGRSVAEMVTSPLPLDKAIDYATQTATGLQAAHAFFAIDFLLKLTNHSF